MVQVDIPVAFATAGMFAAAVEEGLRSSRAPYFFQRALASSLIFQLLVVVWLPIYLLVAHFGFQTSHMWWKGNSVVEHPWVLPVFLILYFAGHLAGFTIAAALVRRGRRRTVFGIFAAAFVFFGAWMALQPYRTLTLGTYAEWQAGTARWIWSDAPFMGLLGFAMVAYFGGLRFCYLRLKREAAPLLQPAAPAAGRRA